MTRIIPQDNNLYAISIAGEVVEIDLTHAAAVASLNLYWEINSGD